MDNNSERMKITKEEFYNAIQLNNKKEIQRYIDNGGDVDVVNSEGKTALMLASSWGYIKTCQMLIAAGANVNVHDNKDMTPLMHASCTGQFNVVKLLIDEGSMIIDTNNIGCTAADFAAKYGFENVFMLLEESLTEERKVSEILTKIPDGNDVGVIGDIKYEKMPTIRTYYILSDAKTDKPIGTFTPSKGIVNGIELYNGSESINDSVKNIKELYEISQNGENKHLKNETK